jgi:hypothetical protein
MSQLKPVALEFKGETYEVTSDDGIWGLIETIEGVITLQELVEKVNTPGMPWARIFRAYAAALNYAGCKTTPMEVRGECQNIKGEVVSGMAGLPVSLIAILALAMPPLDSELRDLEPTGPGDDKKKSTGG